MTTWNRDDSDLTTVLGLNSTTVGNIRITGNTIGHSSDTDILTFAENTLDITALNVDINGSLDIKNSAGNTTYVSLSSSGISGTLITAAQPNITTVGTIGTGVWNATALTAAKVPDHDNLNGFVVNEHLDWTNNQGSANIHQSNILWANGQSFDNDNAGIVPNPGSTGTTTKYLREDGNFQIPPDTNTQLSTEEVQDIVGNMFSLNTEVRISATYVDGGVGAGKINLEVDDLNTDTTYTGGTNLTLDGTTFNVDDAFLINSGDDSTSGVITAGGFTTTGTWTFDTSAGGTTGITNVNVGSAFTDSDTTIMSAGAIKEKIESYNYSATTGTITSVEVTTDTGSGGRYNQSSSAASISILGTSGIGVTNSSGTITVTSVPSEIDHDSLDNFAANEHFRQADIVTVGSITTGEWTATPIAHAYIGNDAIEGDNLADNAVNSEHYTDGSIDTDHIADDQVTYAKIQNVSATDRILGRDSSGAGIIEEITPTNLRAMINVENNSTADQTQADINGLAITTVGTIDSGTWQGTAIADTYISSASTWNAKQNAITFGIDITNIPLCSADVARSDFLKINSDSDTMEGRTAAEVKSDLSLNNVENTALSTFAGTSNITTLASNLSLGGSPTTTTQTAGNSSTKIATTEFVSTAVSNLVDSSPAALNTLNELAAALGDDADFSTTVTNSIATKAPLASPTFTGTVTMPATIASAGDLTLDVAGDITLDADGGDITIVDNSPSSFKPSFQITSTDAGSFGPIVTYKHNSTSPVNTDQIFTKSIIGKNDAGQDVTYINDSVVLTDVADGEERAYCQKSLMTHGTLRNAIKFLAQSDSTVDTDIGYGAASSTTIAGDLTITGGNITNAITFDAGITDAGTIAAGTWNGTAIADGKIASASTWNAKADLTGSTNNTIATVTGANALAGEANLTFDGTDLSVASTGKLILGAGDTSISESSADVLSFDVGGQNMILVTEGGSSGTIEFNNCSTGVMIPAATSLYFDGGTNTHISESSADNMRFTVGNDTVLDLTEDATGTTINMGTSATGFTRSTYADATDVTVDFRTGNKSHLDMTGGSIGGTLTLQFPAVSGNFVLVVQQDGTARTINAYATKDAAGNAGNNDGGTAGAVRWAGGGTAPDLTDGGNKRDILSFYWDATEEVCYGVASLNF